MFIFLHVSGNGPGKLLDPRKKMVERIVRFGDSPNVSNTIIERKIMNIFLSIHFNI